MTEAVDLEKDDPPAVNRRNLGAELFAVLFISYLMSGVNSILSIIRTEVITQGHIKAATACIRCTPPVTHPWLDFFDNLSGLVFGFGTPILALVLLARTPGGPGFGIGLVWKRYGRSIGQGIGFFALIGLPGIGLLRLAHLTGANVTLDAFSFPDVWYRLPFLFVTAFQSGLGEEIVVTAFMLTRLRQLGWSKPRALLAESTLRGSYHLYQGFGAFAGNFVMGLIFGWWFQRTQRVWPLVIAHFLLDAVSFYVSLEYPSFVNRVIG